MPDDVGYPNPQAKTNPTGHGGALGLLSSKLATGLARRKQKRAGLQTQKSQPLSQQAMGQQQQAMQQQQTQNVRGAAQNQLGSQRAGMLDYMKRTTQQNQPPRRKKSHMSTSQAETMGLD